MRIAISADHRGITTVNTLTALLRGEGHDVVNHCDDAAETSCDYPDRAYPVAMAVSEGSADRGILVCGSGIGMCMCANKVRSIRAALVHDELTAELSRRHNDANVLCLSADMLSPDAIERIVRVWLDTEFEGGRHQRRVNKIAMIESGEDPSQLSESASSAT